MDMVATIEDYSASVTISQMVKVPQLKDGAPLQKNGRLIKYSGGFCVVFPYCVGHKKYALRCWHTPVSEMQRRSIVIAQALKESGLPYFTKFEYVPDAVMTSCGMQPAIIMDWVDAMPLKKYISINLRNPEKLINLAGEFLKMVKELHMANISHGDLQHSNILVNKEGMLTLVDYDSMYVPALEGAKEEIKGLPGYQHPSRAKQVLMSPHSDYFSELVIYTSILAVSRHPHLWKELRMEDSDCLILSEEDILSGGRTKIFDILDGDVELCPLCRNLRDALREKDIENLLPLECSIDDFGARIIKILEEKWSDNGFLQCPPFTEYPNIAAKISKRWNNA